MQLAIAITCCALSFATPFLVGNKGLIEDRIWDSAISSGSAMPLRSFVSHFPESRFVAEAEERIESLQVRRSYRPLYGVSHVQ